MHVCLYGGEFFIVLIVTKACSQRKVPKLSVSGSVVCQLMKPEAIREDTLGTRCYCTLCVTVQQVVLCAHDTFE